MNLTSIVTAKLQQRTNERVMLAFLLAISIKILSEAPMGVDFSHFRGARGTKNKKLVKKKSKLSYKLKLIVSKLLSSHLNRFANLVHLSIP